MIYKTHKEIVAPLGSTGLNNKQLFEKYKNEYNIFFESGTHKGDSVKIALDLNFKKIFSVEINQDYYLECFNKFVDEIRNGKVYLFFGDSNVWMELMLKLVNEPCLFWLDGHPDGIDGNPIWGELEEIKKHHIKTHTIIIDDVPIYFREKDLKDKLLEINPNYSFSYENAVNMNNNEVYENYRLISFVK